MSLFQCSLGCEVDPRENFLGVVEPNGVIVVNHKLTLHSQDFKMVVLLEVIANLIGLLLAVLFTVGLDQMDIFSKLSPVIFDTLILANRREKVDDYGESTSES